MRKIRNKIIAMLLLINLLASVLAGIIKDALIPEIMDDQLLAYLDLLENVAQSGITLVIFALFVIVGVREITEPVIRLSKATKLIAAGDFAVEIPPSKRRDEIGELEKNFGLMVKELQSTEYMQKDFINNVSHEYKTPLSIIAGNAKLLQSGSLTPEQQTQCSAFILEETQRLSQMTSNILMLSKLENQSIQPAFTSFSLDEQLRQAALIYISQCEEKELELDIDLPELRVSGSEELLLHVWTNLLDNAVKFSPPGGRISLRASQSAGQVMVSLSDQGAGMDEAVKARIFDQFYQGDTSRQGAGSGLGLSLVKRIVQLHEGRVEVESTPGVGTTFTVTLPDRTA